MVLSPTIVDFLFILMGHLMCKYELFWKEVSVDFLKFRWLLRKEVSVDFLKFRWLLRPVGLLSRLCYVMFIFCNFELQFCFLRFIDKCDWKLAAKMESNSFFIVFRHFQMCSEVARYSYHQTSNRTECWEDT